MAEYIEREKVLRDIEEAMKFRGLGCIAATAMERYIKRQPAANVVEVVHGRWERMVGAMPPEYHGRHKCSCCGSKALDWKFYEELSNYCPNCGARMGGEKDG